MVMTKRWYQSNEMLRKVLVYSWMKRQPYEQPVRQQLLMKRWQRQERKREIGFMWRNSKFVNRGNRWVAICWGDR